MGYQPLERREGNGYPVPGGRPSLSMPFWDLTGPPLGQAD
jgi:hypothetical protein